METLEALPWVAESVRAFAPGKPYRVGPSMLGMRDNPYGAAPIPNPENRRVAMAINDPRQRGLFGAAWNLGYAARMAEGGADALTLSAPVGACGVVYAGTDAPQPWFDEVGAGVYPLYHVLRDLGQAAGKPQLAARSSRPGAVQAIAWRDNGRLVLWLANLTGQEQSVAVAGSPAGQATIARLDLERFVTATSGPEGLARTETSGSPGPVDLGPYAVVRLEFGS
jgi:D-apionolactonase